MTLKWQCMGNDIDPLPSGGEIGSMINFRFYELGALLHQLNLERILRINITHRDFSQPISAKDADDLSKWLGIAEDLSTQMGWTPVLMRVPHFRKKLNRNDSDNDIRHELDVLCENIFDCAKEEHFFRYDKEDFHILWEWKKDWNDVVSKIPDLDKDIVSACDLYCLGHYSASVYHCMRILEIGLRITSSRLSVEFEGRNWYNIINDIESTIKSLQNLPKNERAMVQNYYAMLAKEFSYFKDGWRNYASHGRSDYDKYQARSVLEHVRTFMAFVAAGPPVALSSSGDD